MIDFTKIRFLDKEKIEKTLKNQKDTYPLFGKYNHSKETADSSSIRSNRENLLIRVTGNSAFLENSLHIYYNLKSGKGDQNYDDFNFCNILTALEMLEAELN